MDPLFLDKSNPAVYAAMTDVTRAVAKARDEAGIDRRLSELLNVRVSQLNGCVYCLDLHTHKLLGLGESPQRLAVLTAWREAGLFTETERAALELAEIVTLLPEPEERIAAEYRVREVLSDAEYAALAWVAITMNAFNRVSITSRHPVKPRA